MGGANIQIVHYFDHGYLEEEKSMIHSFTVTFGAKYLTGMVTRVVFLPTKLSALLKIIFFLSLKLQKSLRKFKFLRYVTFMSRWSYDIHFHKYAGFALLTT